MTKVDMITAIIKTAERYPKLKSELSHKMEIAKNESESLEDGWDDYSMIDALNDVITFIDEGLMERKGIWTPCKSLMVQLGIVVEIDPTEHVISCSSGRKVKPEWFKYKKKYYQFA